MRPPDKILEQPVQYTPQKATYKTTGLKKSIFTHIIYYMKISLTLLLVLSFATAKAQLLAPDTVCVGKPFTATLQDTGWLYSFSPNNTGITYAVGNTNVVNPGRQLTYGGAVTMAEENGKYYAFFASENQSLYRLSFGTNPNNPPGTSNMGQFGFSYPKYIELVNDGANWFGFITQYRKIIRLDFGSSLANTPTSSVIDLNGYTQTINQVTFKKYNGQWVAFASTEYVNNIIRLDFGTSLANTPGINTLYTPNFGVRCFSLYRQGSDWRMLVLDSRKISIGRVDFGPDLMSNTPTLANLGNPGLISGYNSIRLIPDCNGLSAIITNTNDSVQKLDFGNSITNPPALSSINTINALPGLCYARTYWYKDTLHMITCNNAKKTFIYQTPILTFDNGTHTGNPSFTHTYTAAGSYNLNVLMDVANPSGPATYCQTIVAVDTDAVAINAAGNALSIPASYKGYQWYLNGVAIPGATTNEWNASASGIYTVEINNAGDCFMHTDPYNHAAVGVYDVQKAAPLPIYPNPSTGNVNIDLRTLQGKVNIGLYNMVGAKMAQYDADGGNNIQLNLSHLPRGMYHVRVTTDTRTITSQLSLQ